MFEILALIGALVVAVFAFKILVGLLGIAFHVVVFTFKLALGLAFLVLLLPLAIAFLPILLVLGVGLAVIGTCVAGVFGWVFCC